MSSTAHIQQAKTGNTQNNAQQSSAERSGETHRAFVDQRPQAIAQRRLQDMANNSAPARQLQALQRKMQNGAPAIQRKKIDALSGASDELRKKAIVAACVALKSGVPIAEAADPDKALEALEVLEWREADIDDELFGVIDTFLQQSPEFHIPTTAAIWVGFLERITKGRGKLKQPEKIDLIPQERSEEAEKFRSSVMGNVDKNLADVEKLPSMPKKKADAEKAHALSQRILGGNITINFALDKLFKYSAPRILNAFEARGAGGNSNNIDGPLEGQRRAAEKHHFGIGLDVEPRQRPRYAAINYKHHPSGAAARNDYGLSYMVLSERIRPHCTITIGDTFDAMHTELDGAFPYTPDGVRKLADRIVRSSFAADFDNHEGYSAGHSYLDVQIHADVDIREHVDAIYASTVEMEVFKLDIEAVDRLIGNLTGGVFVREM
jgi:hypothetical protein